MKVMWRLVAVAVLDVWAYKGHKLTTNGCLLALLIGAIHCLTPSSLYLALLAAFFLAGTLASKVKTHTKHKYVEQIELKPATDSRSDHAPRSASQVWCNSGNAAIAILIAQLVPVHWTFLDERVICNTIIAHYAAVTADTLSSELGILAGPPYLVTRPFAGKVPRGTNGGVSFGGLVAGGSGSLLIAFISKLYGIDVLVSATVWGIAGTLLDSLLGATLQSSVTGADGRILEVAGSRVSDNAAGRKHISGRDILTNNQVNWLTSFLIMVVVFFTS